MVEDITTALSRVKWLFVIARNSSFTYKGKAVDIKQVGRELGVRYVLEGSVRKAGNKVRITGPLYRWLHNHRIDQLHRDLGKLERELTQDAGKSRSAEYQTRIAEIEFAVRSLRVARSFEVNLHRLRIHLRIVQEDIRRLRAVN
jgi:hypothetical protein